MADEEKDRSDSAVGASSVGDGGMEVVVGGRYRLLVNSPLPDLDLGDARAFIARDDRNHNDQFFARICPPEIMPRLSIMANLRHMMEASLMRPLEFGPVRWPGMSGTQIAIVFKRPENGPLMVRGASQVHALQPDELARCFLGPATLTLGYMAQRGMTHRGIRPDNMFWDGPLRKSVILGDCVSHAPAVLQPALFESIESAMTPPMGRGPGTIRDDFYALGVTTLVLSSGSVPMADLSPDQIIEAKLARGSFTALMDGERPPFGLRELLRGLLSDDTHNRWGLEQLEQWLGGGLRSSVQEVRTGAVERPFSYKGREISNYRLLAHEFGRDEKTAADTIGDLPFDKWLRRGVNDTAMADRIGMLLEVAQDSGSPGRPGSRHVTQTCMLLDPFGPIRYKGLVSMPNGLGPCLADAFNRRDNDAIKRIAECISMDIALDWYTLQGSTESIIYEQEIKQLKQMQHLLRHTAPGYGIERCLYMLDPSHPCRSGILEGAFVNNVKELLPTLEKLVEEKGELRSVGDRHLTAFIAARIKANIDRALVALEAAQGDVLATKLGMLSIFAQLQAKYGPEQLPHLTAWMAKELEATVTRINSRTLREQMRKRVRALAGRGSLVELHACLNNDRAIGQDETARKKATREFAAAAREIAKLESREFQESAQRLGWKIASAISAVVSFATVCFVALN